MRGIRKIRYTTALWRQWVQAAAIQEGMKKCAFWKITLADGARLDYISSAGLRILLIMQKGCSGGVTLRNINHTVEEIPEQTGFDSLLHIEQ